MVFPKGKSKSFTMTSVPIALSSCYVQNVNLPHPLLRETLEIFKLPFINNTRSKNA